MQFEQTQAKAMKRDEEIANFAKELQDWDGNTEGLIDPLTH